MVGDFNNYDSCTCFNYGICITDGCLLHWIKWLQRAIIVVITVIPIMAVVVKMCIVLLDNIVIMTVIVLTVIIAAMAKTTVMAIIAVVPIK